MASLLEREQAFRVVALARGLALRAVWQAKLRVRRMQQAKRLGSRLGSPRLTVPELRLGPQAQAFFPPVLQSSIPSRARPEFALHLCFYRSNHMW
jgi:hypothetical protein